MDATYALASIAIIGLIAFVIIMTVLDIRRKS